MNTFDVCEKPDEGYTPEQAFVDSSWIARELQTVVVHLVEWLEQQHIQTSAELRQVTTKIDRYVKNAIKANKANLTKVQNSLGLWLANGMGDIGTNLYTVLSKTQLPTNPVEDSQGYAAADPQGQYATIPPPEPETEPDHVLPAPQPLPDPPQVVLRPGDNVITLNIPPGTSVVHLHFNLTVQPAEVRIIHGENAPIGGPEQESEPALIAGIVEQPVPEDDPLPEELELTVEEDLESEL